MSDENRPEERALSASEPEPVGSIVPLGPTTSMDLSALPEETRNAIIADYARGRLDVARRAAELGVEVRALDETLRTLSETVKTVSEGEDAVTISHTQTTSVGRTEIMMGNTEQAQSGKFTRSQTGERDWTPFYIGGGLIAAALVAIAIAASG